MSRESFGEQRSGNVVRRWWRLLRPSDNSLARRGDRVQARVVVILGIFVLLAIPFSFAFGNQRYTDRLVEVERDARTKHSATAELLADAPESTAARGMDTVQVPAQWELADGTIRTGEVSVDKGTTEGSEVSVWLDRSGQLTTEPSTRADAVTSAVTIGLFTWFAVLAGCGVLWGVFHALLIRKYSRSWAQQWARVEREWSRR